MKLLKFKPVYQERVWGGRALEERMGRQLPGSAPVGESWELVDRPEAQSIEVGSGRTLRELLDIDAGSLMGPDFRKGARFPVLVKWLDCSQRLSLQVHPPATVATRLGGEPKTECWYIAEASPTAALFVGLRRGVNRRQFERAVNDGSLEPLVNRFGVTAGQAMLLQAGRLHAIDAGNLILEIQQNSDTTYRVYDWGRKGLDGCPRELHVAESLESIDFDDVEPTPMQPFDRPGERVIADCQEFRIRQHNLCAGESVDLCARQQPRILSLVQGRLRAEDGGTAIDQFENALVPYSSDCTLYAVESCTLLITENFV